jgi:hypothetical protein
MRSTRQIDEANITTESTKLDEKEKQGNRRPSLTRHQRVNNKDGIGKEQNPCIHPNIKQHTHHSREIPYFRLHFFLLHAFHLILNQMTHKWMKWAEQ